MTVRNSMRAHPPPSPSQFLLFYLLIRLPRFCKSVVVDYPQAHSARTLYSRTYVALSSKSNVFRGNGVN
jgi:hypothetical protein